MSATEIQHLRKWPSCYHDSDSTFLVTCSSTFTLWQRNSKSIQQFTGRNHTSSKPNLYVQQLQSIIKSGSITQNRCGMGLSTGVGECSGVMRARAHWRLCARAGHYAPLSISSDSGENSTRVSVPSLIRICTDRRGTALLIKVGD